MPNDIFRLSKLWNPSQDCHMSFSWWHCFWIMTVVTLKQVKIGFLYNYTEDKGFSLTFVSETPGLCYFSNVESGTDHSNIRGDFWARWPLPLVSLAYFQRKIGSEGQVTPFDHNKEEKCISSLFTGVKSDPFHYNLLPPFPVLINETRSLTPSHGRGFYEGPSSLLPQMSNMLSSLTMTSRTESHQGLKWN